MNDTSPPGYSTSSLFQDVSSSVLLNLSPPQDSTTFQLGYLGHGQAFIAGDVQVKFAGSEEETKPRFTKLVITFRGIERVDGAEAIELCEQSQVLWGEGGSSSSSSSVAASDFPPTNSPFKLLITPDLPVCLHLGSSSLEYSLSAELHFSDSNLPPIIRCSPVHLVRTSPPGSRLADVSLPANSNPSFTPSLVSTEEPVSCSVKLQRNVFRRGEAVELVARIEVPTAQAVGDGLRLRTVSAELVRTIEVNSIASGSSSTGSSSDSAHSHRTVLAHSGKSARFSPSRPIVIRLMLHPPAELSCEAITQSTILHSVSFSVVVTVGLFNLNSNANSSSSSHGSTSLDAVLSQPIFIVPSTPSSRTDKQKEAEAHFDAPESSRSWSFLPAPPPPIPLADSPGEGIDGPVPSYVEHGADDPGIASTSRSTPWDQEEEDEEEYDGYEELSIPIAEAGPPPPAIDDDISPPSPSQPTHARLFEPSSTLSTEENEPRDSGDFASFPPLNDSHASLPSPPTSEPSSPPPPLSPLSISHDHYPLPPLAPPPGHLPDENESTRVPTEAPPNVFPENLPPPYIGNAPQANPTLLEFHPDRSSTPSSSIPSSPSIDHSRTHTTLDPPPPLLNPIDSASDSQVRPPIQERRTSESLLRDPPPYQEEAGDRGTEETR
ncbi:uncharacterized protein JCM6883_004099 [Sporobolomyces salmoneus]|uniref:uncharacterized protein n=1 Tax=Sporobolomyces salmoneus TaxID=183962 RepID=UPI00317966BA